MKKTVAAAMAASVLLLSGCGSDDSTSNPGNATGPAPVASGSPTSSDQAKTPGPPVTEQNIEAARTYAESAEVQAALKAGGPQIAGVPQQALDAATELTVCRIAFAVKHGGTPHAPSEVERRQAAYDLARDPKALEECRSRG